LNFPPEEGLDPPLGLVRHITPHVRFSVITGIGNKTGHSFICETSDIWNGQISSFRHYSDSIYLSKSYACKYI